MGREGLADGRPADRIAVSVLVQLRMPAELETEARTHHHGYEAYLRKLESGCGSGARAGTCVPSTERRQEAQADEQDMTEMQNRR